MKENDFLDGVSNIESDVVERFVSMDNKLQKKANKSKPKGVWLRLGSIAACFLLIVSAVIVVPMFREGDLPDWPESSDSHDSSDLPDSSDTPDLPNIPTWNNAQYSARDISQLFSWNTLEGVATNAYTKIYVPNEQYLRIDEISGSEYLDIYQYDAKAHEPNKSEFQAFINRFLPQLCDSLCVAVPEYEIKEKDSTFDTGLSVSTEIGSYRMFMEQGETAYSFSLLNKLAHGDRRIILDGETVQIDQRLSDEEIIDSIQTVKNKLSNIFGVSFSNAKIIRRFNSYSEYGATYVQVYFYNKNAHPLNATQGEPLSDYICVSFDNFENYSGDIVSDSILTVADIHYYKMHNDVNEEYALTANAKKISLEDAEALLYNGYVFGGHSCPLCMAAQDKVDFEGYDFVDMEYVFGYDNETENLTVGIPFYTFYKNIGTSKNGNNIYAKTYVAAIEVSGYDEYFESQKDRHQNNWGVEEVG